MELLLLRGCFYGVSKKKKRKKKVAFKVNCFSVSLVDFKIQSVVPEALRMYCGKFKT